MDTFKLIEEWAEARNLIKGATPQAQMLKLVEEMGELASGMCKRNDEVIKDSIGDCVVVLTILAAQMSMSIEDCIAYSYDQIKDRKGRMVGGIFIKEEDL